MATGDLRKKGGAVLDALFKSSMHALAKNSSSRPNSSKHFSSELACDLAFTLGRGKCLKEVLRLFGVNDRILPKIDLQNSLLPQCYVSWLTAVGLEL